MAANSGFGQEESISILFGIVNEQGTQRLQGLFVEKGKGSSL